MSTPFWEGSLPKWGDTYCPQSGIYHFCSECIRFEVKRYWIPFISMKCLFFNSRFYLAHFQYYFFVQSPHRCSFGFVSAITNNLGLLQVEGCRANNRRRLKWQKILIVQSFQNDTPSSPAGSPSVVTVSIVASKISGALLPKASKVRLA